MHRFQQARIQGAMDVTKPYEFIGFGALLRASAPSFLHFDYNPPRRARPELGFGAAAHARPAGYCINPVIL